MIGCAQILVEHGRRAALVRDLMLAWNACCVMVSADDEWE